MAGYALSAGAACAAVTLVAAGHGGWSRAVALPVCGGAVILVWSAWLLWVLRGQPYPQRTVPLVDGDAPELALLVRQLSLQLQVPTPAGIELSPGCDAWLDPRPGGAVLVIGSPFVWWLRVSELRGLLAPLVAGMAAVGDERISRARRFAARTSVGLRGGSGLAAAIAVANGGKPRFGRGRRIGGGWRSQFADYCEARAELLERAVALEAVAAARLIEPAARAYAHEQINLAAAGWDRVLTRLAQPAWESGVCPIGLNVALVGALTSLGRRDRMAGSLATRLGERPACDLLEEPGRIDSEVSRLAAGVFDGRSFDRHVPWERYVTIVAEPAIRTRAATVPDAHPAAKLVRSLISGRSAAAEDPSGSTGVASSIGPTAATAVTAVARASAAPDPAEASETSGISGTSEAPEGPESSLDAFIAIPGMRTGSSSQPPIGPLDPDALAAYLACRLVDARLAAWSLDWLDGPVLRDRRQHSIPLQDIAAALADTGDPAPLSDWLARG